MDSIGKLVGACAGHGTSVRQRGALLDLVCQLHLTTDYVTCDVKMLSGRWEMGPREVAAFIEELADEGYVVIDERCRRRGRWSYLIRLP